MVVWLTRKLKSTFEIEPSNPYFILRSSQVNTYGRNSLTPHKYSIFSALPTPPPLFKIQDWKLLPTKQKSGIDTVLSLTFTEHWLCLACRWNHFKSVEARLNWCQGCWQFQECQIADLPQWKIAKPWQVTTMVGSKQENFGNCPLQNAGKWHFSTHLPTFLS